MIGALNLLSDRAGQFTEIDRSHHAPVRGACLRSPSRTRGCSNTSASTPAPSRRSQEIGREFASILNLDEVADTHRQPDATRYRLPHVWHPPGQRGHQRTRDEGCGRYGEQASVPRIKIGLGLTGYAALHKQPVLVPDVSQDPRYISLVADARSSWSFRCC